MLLFRFHLQAFNSLGEAAYDAAPVSDEEEEPQTYALSMWFSQIVDKLLAVTDRWELSHFWSWLYSFYV